MNKAPENSPVAWTDHTFTSNSNWLDAIEWNAAAKRDAVRARVLCTPVPDLFADDVTDDYRYELFGLIANCDRLDWLLLTGHPQKMQEFFTDKDAIHAACCEGSAQAIYEKLVGEESSQWFAVHFPMPNVWLGTPVENQRMADERVPVLLQIPAAVRFLYCVPLLGPINLVSKCRQRGSHYKTVVGTEWLGPEEPKLHWIITGGEHGERARPVDSDWFCDIRDQCEIAGTPYFHKQNGQWIDASHPEFGRLPEGRIIHINSAGAIHDEATLPQDESADVITLKFVGIDHTGRLLDGRKHDEFPTPKVAK